MRLIKMIGLAAIAALAAMAFLGASSASADTLCLENAQECLAGSRLAKGDLVEALSLPGSGLGLLLDLNKNIEMECGVYVLGVVGENEGAHVGLWGLITEMKYYECDGICNFATAENLPYLQLADATEQHAIVSQHAKGAGEPAATLSGCPLGVTCLYEFVGNQGLFDIEGDELIANEIPLEELGGKFLCPDDGTFDVKLLTYEHGEPEDELYLSALP